MSLLNYGLRGNIGAGLAIGIGALLVVPVAVRMISGALRPVAEGAVKGGAFLYDTGMKWATGAWDSMSKMMAEADSTVAAGAKAAAPAPAKARARIRKTVKAVEKTQRKRAPGKKPRKA